MKKVIIIGAGLAGAEAAWQAANMGVQVTLYEMRPEKSTPAHKTAEFAELVCSNSLRGAGMENAVGVLKEEMRRLGSIIMEAADANGLSEAQLEEIPSPAVRAKAAEYLKELHDGMRDFRF